MNHSIREFLDPHDRTIVQRMPDSSTPFVRLDRAHELMSRLVEGRITGPDFEPRRQVLLLLQTLGELSCTVNAPDAGAARWCNASDDLLNVLLICADLSAHYEIAPYDATEWPDHTRIGGDGAHSAEHDSHHLLAEVVEAAGWVAEWVLRRTEAVDTASLEPPLSWLIAVPTTELIARTWCLTDRWNLRDTVAAAIRDQLG
ncbi:MAG TPA: hypothetical protein VGG05_21005 [Pseudonocardiaceae bacterium]|jgi:hypothetical protein